jgi:hypothetical protein
MSRTTLFLIISLSLAIDAQAAADREAAVPTLLIPVAGDVAGAFGTQFQTDVTMTNHGAGAVRVGVFWLPQNRSGSLTEPIVTIGITPHATRFFPRFVTGTLGQTGLGAIVFRALNDDGSQNVDARIDAYARIWTPAPAGQPGSYSQGIYASTLGGPGTDDLQPIPASIYGLRQDSTDFRTNYGIVNLADGPRTFDIVVSGETGARLERTVTLPAASMIHEALPPGQRFGQLTIGMVVQYISAPGIITYPWTGFGSSVDNRTGDAWYSKAQAHYRNNQR